MIPVHAKDIQLLDRRLQRCLGIVLAILCDFELTLCNGSLVEEKFVPVQHHLCEVFICNSLKVSGERCRNIRRLHLHDELSPANHVSQPCVQRDNSAICD